MKPVISRPSKLVQRIGCCERNALASRPSTFDSVQRTTAFDARSRTYTSPGLWAPLSTNASAPASWCHTTPLTVPIGTRRLRQLAPRVGVVEAQHADARFVGDHRDRAAVGRERKLSTSQVDGTE